MNLRATARLAATRGDGESLSSWLAAAPIESHALADEDARSWVRPRAALWCPLCFTHADGYRRWYTRKEWFDPRRIVCQQHTLPLIWIRRDSHRLVRPPPLSHPIRNSLRALVDWIETWCKESPCTPAGTLFHRSGCLNDLVFRSVFGREADVQPSLEAFDVGYWRLGLEGWPLPATRRGSPPFHLETCALPDRLALLELVRRISSGLATGVLDGWPPLTVEPSAFEFLSAHLSEMGAIGHVDVASTLRPRR